MVFNNSPSISQLLVCLLLCCWGCTTSSSQPLIPAAAGHGELPAMLPASTIDTIDRQVLATMSRVNRNTVFTEEEGMAEYIIGPGDTLELVFWEARTPTPYTTTVRPDGAISYSFLDDVSISGLTARQADRLLTKELSAFIKDVRLDVSVLEHRSKNALLFGEINILQTGKSGPGKYSLTGKTTILDLIVDAGGYTTNSDLKRVELVRDGRTYTLNLYDAMFKGDMLQNVVIDNGDVVTVPELPEFAERVYVFGEVEQEGIYLYESAFDLLAALGKAGGCTSTAVRDEIQVIRGYGQGEPRVLSASLNDILKRGDIGQNIPLINGDVVYVPRTPIGDINEFIVNTTPLLDYLFYPDKYRTAY